MTRPLSHPGARGTANFKQPTFRKVAPKAAEITPGPSAYRTAHGEDSRLRNISITSSFQQHKDFEPPVPSPGPCEYENPKIEVLQETRPAYTLRIRPKQEALPKHLPVSISPGPAAYGKLREPVPDVQTAPWKEPVDRKVPTKKESFTVGPGDYLNETALDKTLPRNPTMPMAKKTMNGGPKILGEDSPGPKYGMKTSIGRGMAKSMSAKDLKISDRNVGKESTTPGPGAYLKHSSSQPVLVRAPSYIWGAKLHVEGGPANRRSIARVVGPREVGPGKYDAYPDWNFHKTKGFKQTGRPKKASWGMSETTPGPNFNPPSKYSQLYTMQGKNDYKERTAQRLQNPGPGEYDDQSSYAYSTSVKPYDRTKGWTMGLARKDKKIVDIRSNGVGHDDIPIGVSKSKRAATYHMQGRYKPRPVATQPGPGHYNIKQQLFTQKKIVRLH